MDPIFAANGFNTILRENEEERKGALGALTEMNLKATYPMAVAKPGIIPHLCFF